MLFMTSSEFPEKASEGTFIVLIFERKISKRMYAGTQKKKAELGRIKKAREKGFAFAGEYIEIRESKMRRFCNFFLQLFNVRRLNPFVQFVKP